MSTSKKKVSMVFSSLLFAAILLIPATAFNANAQEEYKYQKDDYVKYDDYYGDTNQYKDDRDYAKHDYKEKKSPQVTIKKELFICDEILDAEFEPFESINFNCFATEAQNSYLPPNSDKYIECDESICPGIDESTFSAFLFKDVAFVQDLSSEGEVVNLDKFHYTVTEDELDDRTGFGLDAACSNAGFIDNMSYDRFFTVSGLEVSYEICVLYEGDCQGTIYPGEEKTCTVKNYITQGEIRVLFPNGIGVGSIDGSEVSSSENDINMISENTNIESAQPSNVNNVVSTPDTKVPKSTISNTNSNNNGNDNDKLNTIVSTPTITLDNGLGENTNNNNDNKPSTIIPSPSNNPSTPTTTFIMPSIG